MRLIFRNLTQLLQTDHLFHMQKSLIKSLKPYCAIAIGKQRRYIWHYKDDVMERYGCYFHTVYVLLEWNEHLLFPNIQFIHQNFYSKSQLTDSWKKKPLKYWYCSVLVIIITGILMKVCLPSPKCIVMNLFFHNFVIWLKIYEKHWQNFTALDQ